MKRLDQGAVARLLRRAQWVENEPSLTGGTYLKVD
jgi:hypothetical protein